MGRFIMAAAIAAAAFLTVPALADHPHQARQAAAAPQVSTQAMKEKINELGYEVRRLERERGSFEAHLIDKASGGAVKARFDSTGELLQARLEHQHR